MKNVLISGFSSNWLSVYIDFLLDDKHVKTRHILYVSRAATIRDGASAEYGFVANYLLVKQHRRSRGESKR